MSADAEAWFGSIGIITQDPPHVRGTLVYEATIRLWHNVKINNCLILSYSAVSPNTTILETSVGRYCSIGQDCNVGLSMHPMNRLTSSALTYENVFKSEGDYHFQKFEPQTKRTVIGHDVWIGAGVTVLPGLEIGTGSIIGAGSVVTKNVEPYAIVAGNPASKKKFRFEEETTAKLLASEWWRYDLREAVHKGLITDWSNPLLAMEELETNFSRNNLSKIDSFGRSLWIENSSYKCADLGKKIFV